MLDDPSFGIELVAPAASDAVGPDQTRCRIAPSLHQRFGQQGPGALDHLQGALLGALARLGLDLGFRASQPANPFIAQLFDHVVRAPAGAAAGLSNQRIGFALRGRDNRAAFIGRLLFELLQQRFGLGRGNEIRLIQLSIPRTDLSLPTRLGGGDWFNMSGMMATIGASLRSASSSSPAGICRA